MEDKTLYTLIIFSENLVGLLSQVTAVFTRRQVNIESLNVSASGVEGIHRYTITCWSDESTIQKITLQIEKKIDVVQANYFTEDEIFIFESALFKLATPIMLKNRDISKAIRLHDAQIVEVNSTYSIVTKDGMTEEIVSLYNKLKEFNCVLQYVRSGAIAITKSKRELLNEYLAERKQEHAEHLAQQHK
ncbi:MAG: acetolactate synthase small subunit [Bacteroidaceae bacterium]